MRMSCDFTFVTGIKNGALLWRILHDDPGRTLKTFGFDKVWKRLNSVDDEAPHCYSRLRVVSRLALLWFY